jgi:glutamyl-tRNA reductase
VSALSLPSVEPEGVRSPSRASEGPFPPEPAPLRVVNLEFSLETASLDALEQVARSIPRPRLREWFSRIAGTEEAALLATCHRVELVLLLRSPEGLRRWREVLPGSPTSWRTREGHAAIRHLFRVAAGRESLARGEGEVRRQVRAAGRSVESRHPRPILRELFDSAAEAAEELSRSVSSPHSIAAVAAERLLTLLERPFPRVLVIGSGIVGRQVAERLAARAQVTMLFHRNPPEESFLRTTGARAGQLERLADELSHADAVVTAAKFGDHGIRAADLPRDHPLLLVDLGMPRNIDPDVRELPNVRLVDLENLHASARESDPFDETDERLEVRVDRCADRMQARLAEPWVDALRRGAEALRRSELAGAKSFLGDLTPEQEQAIEKLTQRLVTRLLQPPTDRIRTLPPGPEGDLRRRWALELLHPLVADP